MVRLGWLDWVEENKGRLCSFSTFEEILSELYKKEMKGIGPLVRYDTATQLAFPDKKYPQKVYLSAGAAKGAKALDIVKAYAVDKQVFVDICPDFEKLSEAQIEDFLCIYKSHLNGEIDDKEELGSRGCSSSGSGKSKCCEQFFRPLCRLYSSKRHSGLSLWVWFAGCLQAC